MLPREGWIPRHTRALRRSSAVVPIAVVSFLLIGYSEIIPVTFSGTGTVVVLGTPCYGGQDCGRIGEVTIPAGANATLHWLVTGSGSITFLVAAPGQSFNSANICRDSGMSGTCQFVSVGGTYLLFATSGSSSIPPQTVTYSGSYDTSLL